MISCGQKSVFEKLVSNLPDKAYTKVNRVNMRVSPFILGSKVDVLRKGVELKVVERSETKDIIGSSREYWYRVRMVNGVEGWIYGTGLLFDKPEDDKSDLEIWRIPMDSSMLPDADLRGKWKVSSGGERFNRVDLVLRGDGTFSYQTGIEMPAEGTYSISREKNQIILNSGSLPDGKSFLYTFSGEELRLVSEISGTRVVFRRFSAPAMKRKKIAKEIPGVIREDEDENAEEQSNSPEIDISEPVMETEKSDAE